MPHTSSDSGDSGFRHPTAGQLTDFALGRKSAAGFDGLEQHLIECRECMNQVAGVQPDDFALRVMAAKDSGASLDERGDPVFPPPLKLAAGYVIQEEIGRGGMGIVYRAWHPGLGRLVALKRLRNADASGRKALERFRIEATALARLNHPCIVSIHDVGEQDGQPFIAMELVDGVTLAERLRDRVLESRVAAMLLVQLADAIAAANSQGIIHRDLKPQNVLIGTTRTKQAAGPDSPATGNVPNRKESSGFHGEAGQSPDSAADASGSCLQEPDGLLRPKLVDFGLSRLQGEGKTITETAEVLGTPGYMAPEQFVPGQTVTEAADVYGLGAILYQCLSGRAPFQGATAVETIAMVLSSDVLPLRKLRRDLPTDLQVICHRCLEKDPQRRYPSAAALRDDLNRFLDGRPILARPAGFVRKLVLWTGRNRVVATLSAGILAAIFLAGIAIAVYQHRLRTDRDRANRRYAEARATIWKLIESASSQSIFEVPKLQELLADQARESIALFEQLAVEEQSEESVIDLARLRMLLGTIEIAQGKPNEGELLLREATEAIADIEIRADSTQDLLKMAIAGQVKLATSLYGQGKVNDALEVLAPAQKFAEVLVERNGDSTDNLNQLAWVHHVAGSARIGASDFKAAADDFRLAVGLRTRAFATDSRNTELALYLAGSQVNLALCEASLGESARGLAGYREALEILRRVLSVDPRSSHAAIAAAGARLNASNILAAVPERGEAVSMLTEGIVELQPFLDAAPDDFQIRDSMFKLVASRAMYGDRGAKPDQVLADWNQAINLAVREEDRQFCRDQLQLMTQASQGSEAMSER
jgi:eukaryotic-like serine/threonine-protein kinase